MKNRPTKLPRALLLGVSGLGLSPLVQAHPGYDANVSGWCSASHRPAPNAYLITCDGCHANKDAYRNLRDNTTSRSDLDYFCPQFNLAPSLSLTPSDSQQKLLEGQTLTITAVATDRNGDPVTLTASPLPPGASFDATTGEFKWTPAAGISATHPQTVVTFKAKDAPINGATPKTVKQRVTLSVDDNQPPTLNTLEPQQMATVGEPLKLLVTANPDPDDDKVSFRADNLPPGAKLTSKGLVKGKWTAVFRWTPNPDQVDQDFKTSFVVQDDFIDPAQAAQDVAFHISAPVITDASVRSVNITRAQWDASSSSVLLSGQVRFARHFAMITGVTVTVSDADSGAILGSFDLTDTRGVFTQQLSAAQAPCRIKLEVRGRSATRTVQRAPISCRGAAH